MEDGDIKTLVSWHQYSITMESQFSMRPEDPIAQGTVIFALPFLQK